jgi:type VI secretion system protein ImpC
MDYAVNFGRMSRAAPAAAHGVKFRIAVLGDFSGRANAGLLETGAALAGRKPIKIDVDNLDDVIARMKLSLNLTLAEDGTTVTVPVNSMDDFHPDQLVENVELFESLLQVRRNLATRVTFERAAKEVLSWSGAEPLPPPSRDARGTDVATDRRLSDFARLTGRPSAKEASEQSVDDLVRRIIGPFVQPTRDARQEQLTARVDEALSVAMRRILHHPDFQTAEAVWRGVEFLVRRIETGDRMEIVLYDVSAEEFAADLAAGDGLADSGLYGMLVEQPAMDAYQGPLSLIIGLYGFELTPPHADLLGRAAQIAAAAGGPFVASIGPDALKIPFRDQHPLIKDAWGALYGLPAANYLGLATPRFLLRVPYGRKSDPIDPFEFEEFTRQAGLSSMLWGHPALLVALLLAETFARQGKQMKLGTVASARDMPYYVYVDEDGDQIPLPCTERLYSERQAAMVNGYRMMPTLTLRGRPEVRLGGFSSVAGKPLAGFWAPVEIKPGAEPEPAAAAPVAAPPAPEAAPAAAPDETADLDALLASLSAPEEPAAAAPAPAPAMDELDALLASLNAEPPPAEPDSTEPDLDALLASLK